MTGTVKKYDSWGIIIIYLVQVYLVFVIKTERYGVFINPFLLFSTSLIVPFYYLHLLVQKCNPIYSLPRKKGCTLLYFLAGMATILVSYEEVRKLFARYADPSKLSDVMPQMAVLYSRYIHHEDPYTPISFGSYTLYPAYMPLHWLPLWVPRHLGIDDRWIGYIFLVVAVGIFSISVLRRAGNASSGLIALLLPSIAFWAFIMLGGIEIPASLEPVICAYYLVLASGLAMRNLPLTVFGIILCLLSRYTFIFWLPFFGFLLWQNVRVRENLVAWGTVAICLLLVYVLPFYINNPHALNDGLTYYNNCAINAWTLKDNQTVPGCFSSGLNFGPEMWLWLPGTIAHKVYLSRLIQVGWMITLLVWGRWFYKKHRGQVNYYDFALVMLYLVITFFFMFTAQLFKYYLLTWLVLSAVICAHAVIYITKYDCSNGTNR
jgi:hypothetical protein